MSGPTSVLRALITSWPSVFLFAYVWLYELLRDRESM